MSDPRQNCPEKCPRKDLCINHPKIQGVGPSSARIMLVGEAPGQDEDEEGVPFVGVSGQLLNQVLQQTGIDRNEIYITNAVKCATPDENTKPTKKEINLCRDYLVSEIAKVKPKIIVCLGAVALEAVLKRAGITKLKNNVLFSEEFNAKVIPVWHPAYILRNPLEESSLIAGFELVKKELSSDKILQKDDVKTKYADVSKHPEKINLLLDKLEATEEFVIDLETTSLTPSVAKIICFAFSWGVGLGITVRYDALSKDQLDRLREILLSKKTKIGHNIKYDIQVLRANGIKIRGPYFDTMTALSLINENMKEKGLDACVLTYTNMGEYWIEVEDYKKEYSRKHKIKKESFSYDLLPYYMLSLYAQKDADATYRLYKKFLRELKRQDLLEFYNKYVLPIMEVLVQIEYRGVKVDIEKLEALIEDYSKKLKENNNIVLQDPSVKSYQKIRAKRLARKYIEKWESSRTLKSRFSSGMEYAKKRIKREEVIFNPGSPKQLGEVLFKVLDIMPIKYTDTKAPSTDEEVLTILAEENNVDLCKKILDYRGVQKFLSTYLIGTLENAKLDGRFHPDVFQHRTVTGRLSGNFQQVPRDAHDYKDCLVADPGYTFIKADLAQAEFRCWAHYSEDEDMLSDIAAGLDIHRKIAAEIFNKPEEEISKDSLERTVAKNCSFGLMYGRGTKAIAKQYKISDEQANGIKELFFSRYPKAKRWLDDQVRFARENLYVKSWLGRIRRLPEIISSEMGTRAEAERQSKNAPIQALASDMNNHFMVCNIKRARKAGIKCYPIGTVHDANIVMVKDDQVRDMVSIMQNVLDTAFPDFKCIMKLDFEVGKTLGSMEKFNDHNV